ncbi:hypothetical protein LguiB_027847 [Lonicera macranthoides]
MEFHFLHFFTFLSLALVATQAAPPGELYWRTVLPNSPMPKAIRDLLQPAEWTEDKGTSVGVGKGGVNVDAGKGNQGGSGTNVGVGKGGVNVNTGGKGKRGTVVNVNPGPNPFNYLYAAAEDQLHDNPNVALFFLEKDMRQGTKMNLNFPERTRLAMATFLPREVAEKVPFSSNKLPQIFEHFSVKPNSMEAEIMKNTIKQCEEPGIKEEEKYCSTSLESMIDFSTSKLGKKVQAISTEVLKGTTKLEKYSIVGVRKMASEKAVVCHKENYAYAVFYCHNTHSTKAYMVSLAGDDGSNVKAVAVCHTDTSAWNPKHLAFQVLKVKPGTVPVCHFLPQDHVVWVPY